MKNKGPASGLPFANTMGDSLDLMQKMWGMAGLPGMPNAGNLASMAMRLPQQLPSMVAPTLDVNELDKRIADLRAVEQWLELNSQHAAHDDPDARSAARDDRHAEGHQRGDAGAAHQVRPESGRQQRTAADAFPMPPMPGAERARAARKEQPQGATRRKPPHRADRHRGAAESHRLVEHAAGSVHQDRGDALRRVPPRRPRRSRRRSPSRGQAAPRKAGKSA